MNKYAVIVAGGSGQRMGTEIPKQFLLLKGKPILHHTIQSFLLAYADMKIILVLPQAHLQKGQEIIKAMRAEKKVQITVGGATRFESVKNGLNYISHPSIVFVHDGVRCLVSRQLIQNCFKQAVEKGNAVPAVAATDSIRLDDGTTHYTVDRNKVRIIQTPQTFRSELLAEAFKADYSEAFTDEATVIEAAGKQVYLIEGDYNNLKITRPIDLCIAEKILEDNSDSQLV